MAAAQCAEAMAPSGPIAVSYTHLGEVEAWLKQMGPPMQVAARYQPQQYLIGPAVFPTYWFVLRTAFLWALIIYSIVSAVLIVVKTPSGMAVLEAVLRVPGVLLTTAAWVTLVFAVIEFAATHYPAKCPAIAGFSACLLYTSRCV